MKFNKNYLSFYILIFAFILNIGIFSYLVISSDSPVESEIKLEEITLPEIKIDIFRNLFLT
jgi:hypothetical protein